MHFYDERRYSSLKSFNPDSNIYPKYYTSKKFEIELNEGEAITIPCGWLHYIYSNPPTSPDKYNIALNYFNKNIISELHIFRDSYKLHSNIENIDSYKSSEINYTDINNSFQKNIPIHIKNIFDNKCNSKLDFFNLYNLLENSNIDVLVSSTQFFPPLNLLPYESSQSIYTSNIAFSDFLSWNHSEPNSCNIYIMDNYQYSKKLYKYIPQFINSNELFSTNLWVNYGNIFSLLHYDPYDNIFIQHVGSRKIILIPPYEQKNMYMLNPYPIEFVIQLKESRIFKNDYINFIQDFDNVLPKNICNRIINDFKTNKSFSAENKTYVISMLTENYRDYYNINRLNDIYPYICPNLYNISDVYPLEIKKKTTLKFCNSWIMDHEFYIDSDKVILENTNTFILYLNTLQCGGELEVMLNNYNPICGKLYIFPSHESLPYRIHMPISEDLYIIKGTFRRKVNINVIH